MIRPIPRDPVEIVATAIIMLTEAVAFVLVVACIAVWWVLT